MPKPTGFYSFFQTTLQTVRGRLGGGSGTIAPLQSRNLLTNSANAFVKLSESTTIDLEKDELSKILGNYAAQSKNIEDKHDMNKAMIKLFYKLIDNQSPDKIISQSLRTYPEAATVFENILSGEPPRAHKNGISSLAFAFVSILSLSLNGDDPNQASPYFDLSPLYGSSDKETDTIRTKDGSGTLWRDCFIEDRLATLSGAAITLLILWNRFHNKTATYLFWHKERDEKWIDPSELEKGSQKLLSQDDHIFSLARSITCINFMNIVKEDILKGFFGLPFVGPSVEVDILHEVRGLMDETRMGHCSSVLAYFLYDFTSLTPPSVVDKPSDMVNVDDHDVRQRTYMGLLRNDNGYFDDGQLAGILFDAIESSAGTPGARSISKRDRERVIRKIKQGQKWNVCTLNVFREYLGIERLQSFSEWNPDPTIAGAAEELYGNIDNLELYPGLLAEESPAGSGFGFGRTMTWGLIADIVTRIRSDTRFTAKFKEEELTKWGYHDCMTTLSQGPSNAVLPKLLYRTLPHNFPYKNAYSLYPFTVPTHESKERTQNKAEPKYDIDFSRPRKVKVLRTIEAISNVFNHPDQFPSPYNRDYRELTGGYGNMLGFDDLTLHDRDLMLILFALLPDNGAAKRIGATFRKKTQKYLRDRCVLLSGNTRARIDIIEDVIDATCVSWVCETIYGHDLHNEKEKETETREDFAACYAYIFRNGEPEIVLNVRERALNASRTLGDLLEKKLLELKQDGDSLDYWQSLQEFSIAGGKIPQASALTFLNSIMKATESKPLKNVVDSIPHLLILKQKYQNEDTKRSEKEARKLLEKQRIVANVIALSVVISVHFSKVCAQAVDFYLDEKYSSHRARLIELCTSEKSTNYEIMGYIREAQRIGQRFGLWRDVRLPSTEPWVSIHQGHGHPDVIIEQGDRVFADFSFAHNDPKQFEEPHKVIPSRKITSLQGLGLHKCPAGAFIDETMAEMFRVIFSQRNLARAREKGQLRATTLHQNPAPWDSEVFLEDLDGYSFYPRKLMLEFDANQNIIRSRNNTDDLTSKHNWFNFRLSESTSNSVLLYLFSLISFIPALYVTAIFILIIKDLVKSTFHIFMFLAT